MQGEELNTAALRAVAMQLIAAQPHPTPASIRKAIADCQFIPAFQVSDEAAEAP